MDITERKITKIAREAEKLVLLSLREEGVGTAEIDLIHALRHHPGCTQAQLAELLLEHDVTQTVSDLETGRALARAAQAVGRTLKIHVKVDTGMTRLGFLWREGGERETAAAIAALCALPGLEAEGLFTPVSYTHLTLPTILRV